jgi:hypothetical protein
MLLFAFEYTHAQNDSTAKARQLIKMEQELTDALPADSIVWEKYLDPHWYITTEDGSGMTCRQYMATFGPFPKGITGNIKVTNPVFSFHDNIAVIHYVADEYETAYGQQLHTTYAIIDTWYKTGTTWKMLSMQSFEIPALPPAIKVDSAILRQYTGTYQLTGNNTVVVGLKNDTLYIQRGKGPPQALLPETSNVFFRKADTRGRRVFVKDKTGQMLMLARRNGQDLVWTRIE